MPWWYQYMSLIMLVVVFALMYFIMIRPQNKKRKEEQKMRDSIRVGDEIVTIGGICGRVVNVKEDTLIIETGADRNKMSVKKWALQECLTVHDTTETDDDDDDDLD
ncbi:MAG: preprotein translocase subunit YajC [Clostridia bacterium]|nr:preprotein translocase subunit YajC [Clostridia bacterium]